MLPRVRLGAIAGVAVATTALLLCGCGSSAAKKTTSRAGSKFTAASFRPKDCQPAGSHGAVSYQLCRRQVGNQHGTFLRVQGKERTVLTLLHPGPTPTSPKYGGRYGYWDWAALSPDGTQFLAEWRGDCEAPYNFLVSLGGGKPIPVTGEKDWLKSPETLSFGWSTDGRAILFIPTKPACGHGVFHPGVYLVSASFGLQLIRAGKEPPLYSERSLKPRSLARLRAILGPSSS
ncbi:MAG: hypothetical protein ABSB96_01210 [Gaiellaceae bacterium]